MGCRVYIRGKGSIKDPEKVPFFPLQISIPLESFKFLSIFFYGQIHHKFLIQLLLNFHKVEHDSHCFFIFFYSKGRVFKGKTGLWASKWAVTYSNWGWITCQCYRYKTETSTGNHRRTAQACGISLTLILLLYYLAFLALCGIFFLFDSLYFWFLSTFWSHSYNL